MPRPVPSPSVVLVDPGNTPIVSLGAGNYYLAAKYNCSGVLCGQFISNVTVNSGIVPLVTGLWYKSTNTPGFVYQIISPALASTSAVAVSSTFYSSCNSACIAANIQPTPQPSVSSTPSATPSPTRTPSVTPTRSPGSSPSPSKTPSVTPSVTPTISVTPSITPTISITPSGTPYPSPQVGIYVTCSFQILDTIPGSTNSELLGNITGSYSSNVSSSGVFIPSSSYQTSMINSFPQAYTYVWNALMVGIPIPGSNGGSMGYDTRPSKLVVSNNEIVSSSLYLPIPNFTNDATLKLNCVINKIGPNDTQYYNLRTRVYKNTYLIYDEVHLIHPQNYSQPDFSGWYSPYSVSYGTVCDGDLINVVYSLA